MGDTQKCNNDTDSVKDFKKPSAKLVLWFSLLQRS